jgi:hypothetical protein
MVFESRHVEGKYGYLMKQEKFTFEVRGSNEEKITSKDKSSAYISAAKWLKRG